MMTQKDEQVRFLPFHALNHFMMDDFRTRVVKTVLENYSALERDVQKDIDRQTAKHVKVPGFRNSTKAPARIKLKPMVSAFEKNADLVANIIHAWMAIKPELAGQVEGLLKARGWELLPLDADRRKVPGFLTRWPKDDEFDVLYDAYNASNPDPAFDQDEVSLMIVWVSGRLPVDMVDQDESAENFAE